MGKIFEKIKKLKGSSRKIRLNQVYNLEMFFTGLLFILIIVFSFYGLSLVREAVKLNEYTPFPQNTYDYHFYVVSDGRVLDNLNQVYIKQDFSEGKGEFTFLIDSPFKKLEKVMMSFPTEIDEKSIKCYTQPMINYIRTFVGYANDNFEEFPCFVNKLDNNSLMVNFFGTEFEQTQIFVRYSLNILPNNEYKIFTGDWYGSGLSGNFILDFGDKYECFSECIFDFHNTELDLRYSDSREKHLTFNKEINQITNRFKVLSKSRKIFDAKTSNLALGIALVAGSIFALFSVTIYFFQVYNQKRRDKIKKEEFSNMEKRIIDKLRKTLYNKNKK